MKHSETSRPKATAIFILTILVGYGLFIAPNLFFGITKVNGGYTGTNLLLTAIFQCVTVILLLYYSLKKLGKDFLDIGLVFAHWKRDALLGLLAGLTWTLLQFILVIPATGGASRPDMVGLLSLFDGSLWGTLCFLALGVIGGGITEEVFNRGYFITILTDLFDNRKVGLAVAVALSMLLFIVGHLPSGAVAWFDLLIPTTAYTVLFLYTRRLTASMVAHGVYNATAILASFHLYY